VTRGQAQADLAARLGSPSEARWLLEHVAGPGTGGDLLGPEAADRLAVLADRRLAGEPLQYVLGQWAFRTLELGVDPRVLVPRPETEQVVEVALRELAWVAQSHDLPVACDLGTGSGAIALSLAVEGASRHPGLEVWATDADPRALERAAENLAMVWAGRPGPGPSVRLCHGCWYEALPAGLRGGLSLVVANPPYVAEDEWDDLDPEVRAEPRQALVAAAASDGTPGLADVEAVLVAAPTWLDRPGSAVVEMAPHQAAAALALAERAGCDEAWVEPDLAGRDRALVARWR